jgi:hypothetical protein
VASRFTVRSLIAGQSWLPATKVPFSSDLWSWCCGICHYISFLI